MARKTAAPTINATMRAVILRGPDRYLRDQYTTILREALEGAFGGLEVFTFEGDRTEPAIVLDELRSYGLMQTHKLVIVDSAEVFLAAKEGGSRKTPRTLVENYLAAPVESATLLLRADTWRPGKIDKLVAAIGAVIKCDAPTERQAIAFCSARIEKQHGATMAPRAAEMLVERVGLHLARLDVELGKLAAFVGAGGTVSEDDVRAMVGLSREEQAWSIQSALIGGSTADAIRKLRELRAVSNQPDQLVTWAITDLMRKIHTAARLLDGGTPEAAVAKEIKLWGDGRGPTLRAARSLGPDRAGRLFDRCLEVDAMTKRGLGNSTRNLEVLAMEIADTMASA